MNITGTAATTKLLVQNSVNDSSSSGVFLGNQIRGEASLKQQTDALGVQTITLKNGTNTTTIKEAEIDVIVPVITSRVQTSGNTAAQEFVTKAYVTAAIPDVSGYATTAALNSEITNRTNADITLQNDINTRATQSTTYTKTQTDTLLSAYRPLTSPDTKIVSTDSLNKVETLGGTNGIRVTASGNVVGNIGMQPG